jgi:hypothetical protein
MTSPDRLDPLSFAGCFADLEGDIPAGLTLAAWRSQRTAGTDAAAGADLAPQGRTLRARMRARRPRGGRGPSPRRNR